jgi:hypothetical protein
MHGLLSPFPTPYQIGARFLPGASLRRAPNYAVPLKEFALYIPVRSSVREGPVRIITVLALYLPNLRKKGADASHLNVAY